jgi:hypothetical protein
MGIKRPTSSSTTSLYPIQIDLLLIWGPHISIFTKCLKDKAPSLPPHQLMLQFIRQPLVSGILLLVLFLLAGGIVEVDITLATALETGTVVSHTHTKDLNRNKTKITYGIGKRERETPTPT